MSSLLSLLLPSPPSKDVHVSCILCEFLLMSETSFRLVRLTGSHLTLDFFPPLSQRHSFNEGADLLTLLQEGPFFNQYGVTMETSLLPVRYWRTFRYEFLNCLCTCGGKVMVLLGSFCRYFFFFITTRLF